MLKREKRTGSFLVSFSSEPRNEGRGITIPLIATEDKKREINLCFINEGGGERVPGSFPSKKKRTSISFAIRREGGETTMCKPGGPLGREESRFPLSIRRNRGSDYFRKEGKRQVVLPISP